MSVANPVPGPRGATGPAGPIGTAAVNGTPLPVETELNFLAGFTGADNPGNGSTDIGLLVAPATVYPETYGAVGDNSNDDTTAIQNAFNAVKTSGGTVMFNASKTYKITAPIYLGNNTKAVRLTSAGGVGQINEGAATVHLSGNSGGTGNAGGALQFNTAANVSAFAIEVDHLRFTYDPNSFKGANTYLINVSPHANGAGDIQPFHIHHCAFTATAAVTPSNGCQALVRLNQAIIGSITDCQCGSAQEGIRVGDPGGSYVNVVTIQRCAFNFMQSAHIMVGTTDGESVTIRDCTFEDCPANAAIYGNTDALYNALIEGCWFGDFSSTFTPVTWIKLDAQGSYTCAIKGNRFAALDGNSYHLNLSGAWLIEGNTFEGGKAIYNSDGSVNGAYVAIANFYNNPTAIFDGGTFGHDEPATNYISIGNITVGAAADPQSSQDRVQRLAWGSRSYGNYDIGAGAGIANGEAIAIGTHNARSIIANPQSALFYTDFDGRPILQPPHGQDVRIADGDTTTPVVRAAFSAAGAGFNGKNPSWPVLATGAGHTVDDVITFLQNIGLAHP